MGNNAVWQFNGTLFDSDKNTIAALHDALVKLRIDPIEFDPYYDYEQLKEVGTIDLLHRTAAEFGLTLDRLIELFQQSLKQRFKNLSMRTGGKNQLLNITKMGGHNFLLANGPVDEIKHNLLKQKITGLFTDILIDEQPLSQAGIQTNITRLVNQNHLASRATSVVFSDAISANVVEQLGLNGYLLDVDGLLSTGQDFLTTIHSLTELKLI